MVGSAWHPVVTVTTKALRREVVVNNGEEVRVTSSEREGEASGARAARMSGPW